MKTVHYPWVLVLVAACSDGGDDFDAPACVEGEVAVEGVLDGDTVAENRTDPTSYAFFNKLNELEPGSLDVMFADGTALHLEWNRLVANGGVVDARGFVDFSATGDVIAGNCETGGFPSTLRMDAEGGGGTFALRELHASPFCEGASLAGELTGCFRSPDR